MRGEIRGDQTFTRCAWTPFEGYPVRGRLVRTVLRGREAYRDGQVLALPGTGRNIRKEGFIHEANEQIPARLISNQEEK
jgi:hypothetical protein